MSWSESRPAELSKLLEMIDDESAQSRLTGSVMNDRTGDKRLFVGDLKE